MNRFLVLALVSAAMAIAASLYLYNTITPKVGKLALKETAFSSTARPAGGPGVPVRLQRALADRDRKYHEAKIRLARPADQFVSHIKGIFGKLKANKDAIERERWQNDVRSRNGLSPVDYAQPLDLASDYAQVDISRDDFQTAVAQYRDDIQAVDYAFYKEFADIYGVNGEKKHAPIPVDRELDVRIGTALLLADHDEDWKSTIPSGYSFEEAVHFVGQMMESKPVQQQSTFRLKSANSSKNQN
jgi:hypothetical protein